jgi:hypothetical protein
MVGGARPGDYVGVEEMARARAAVDGVLAGGGVKVVDLGGVIG